MNDFEKGTYFARGSVGIGVAPVRRPISTLVSSQNLHLTRVRADIQFFANLSGITHPADHLQKVWTECLDQSHTLETIFDD